MGIDLFSCDKSLLKFYLNLGKAGLDIFCNVLV